MHIGMIKRINRGLGLSLCVIGLNPLLARAEDASSVPAAAVPADAPPPAAAASMPADVPKPAPPPPTPPPHWSGDFSAGYVKSSGNSSASTLNVKFDVDYKSDPWDNLLTGSAFRASSQGVNTDEKYSIGDKLLYNLNPDSYVFGQVNFDDDHYGPIAERLSGSTGYGRHILKSATQTLDMDLDVGADHTRDQGAGHFRSSVIGTFDASYLWKISGNSQFKQTLRTEFGPHNTFIDPVTELKLTIIANFFAALDYELRYNTETPAGTYHSDQITSINIGYAFGKPPTATPP